NGLTQRSVPRLASTPTIHRWLPRLELVAHRARARCAGDGDLASSTPAPDWSHSPKRPRRAIPLDSLHRAFRGSWRSLLGRLACRQLRQYLGGTLHLIPALRPVFTGPPRMELMRSATREGSCRRLVQNRTFIVVGFGGNQAMAIPRLQGSDG